MLMHELLHSPSFVDHVWELYLVCLTFMPLDYTRYIRAHHACSYVRVSCVCFTSEWVCLVNQLPCKRALLSRV